MTNSQATGESTQFVSRKLLFADYGNGSAGLEH